MYELSGVVVAGALAGTVSFVLVSSIKGTLTLDAILTIRISNRRYVYIYTVCIYFEGVIVRNGWMGLWAAGTYGWRAVMVV